MRKFIIATSFFILSACATNRMLYVNEKGQTVYQADCGGMWQNINMGDCLIKAGQQCPTGFNILMANDQISGISNGTQTFGDINTNSYANGQAQIFGNNAFAQGWGNSQTSFNANSWGGSSFSHDRYIIYTCK